MKHKQPSLKVKPLAAAVNAATQPAPAAPAKPALSLNQALFDAVTAQRNEAMNTVATLSANLAVATAAIHEQDAVIVELRARLKSYEAPQATPAGKSAAAAPH